MPWTMTKILSGWLLFIVSKPSSLPSFSLPFLYSPLLIPLHYAPPSNIPILYRGSLHLANVTPGTGPPVEPQEVPSALLGTPSNTSLTVHLDFGGFDPPDLDSNHKEKVVSFYWYQRFYNTFPLITN